MAHIIPSAIKTGLPSDINDWVNISIPEYRSCFDSNGFGGWQVVELFGGSFFNQTKAGNSLNLRLLNLIGDGQEERQRADLYIANQECSDIEYDLTVTGVVETFNSGFEFLTGKINGVAVDFGGYTMTKPDGTVHTFPQNTTILESQFSDNDVGEIGALVDGSPITFTVPAGPCETLITFHADTVDSDHNSTSLGNIFYNINITKK